MLTLVCVGMTGYFFGAMTNEVMRSSRDRQASTRGGPITVCYDGSDSQYQIGGPNATSRFQLILSSIFEGIRASAVAISDCIKSVILMYRTLRLINLTPFQRFLAMTRDFIFPVILKPALLLFVKYTSLKITSGLKLGKYAFRLLKFA